MSQKLWDITKKLVAHPESSQNILAQEKLALQGIDEVELQAVTQHFENRDNKIMKSNPNTEGAMWL